MNKINKKSLLAIISLLIVYSFSFLILPQAPAPKAFAQNYNFQTGLQQINQGSPVDISNPQKIFDILSKIVRWTYTIFFIVAVFFVLLAAYNYLFSQGDPTRVKLARWQIIWAAVAIAVALISVGAAQIISSFLNNP